MTPTLKRIALPLLLVSLGLPGLILSATGTTDPVVVDADRARLVSYTLKEQLPRHHYSHKAIDDELSLVAFDLYLEQLDPQKKFLLATDVERLRAYADRIDDEILAGRPELARVGFEILTRRTGQVRTLVEELLATPFDFSRAESFETDPDKLTFVRTEKELRDRWRLAIKFQVLNTLLNLQEDEPGEASDEKRPARSDAELAAAAREKTAKTYRDYFDRLDRETVQDHYDRFFDTLTRAFDPHTNYLAPTAKEDFDIAMRGSLEGIGATLREEGGYIKVVDIIPGGAAARQGQLQAEDIILKVGEGDKEPVDITDTRIRDAVRLIRGKKGTEVRLTVKKPDGLRLVIPIVRDVFQIEETFARSDLLKDGDRRYGFLQIPSFYRDFEEDGTGRNVTDDVRLELAKLKGEGLDGLILDLRNDGGGALQDAVAIAGLFIETGPVVQVRSGNGHIQVLRDSDEEIVYGGPMVVLVNQFSASASEILAGALQDYGRAVIVGSRHTHGKGTVQAILDLDRTVPFRNMDHLKPLGALKVTIQKFYRITGESTQYRGVVPDIVLPDRMEYLKTGEKYFENSLPWDTIAATDFRPWRMLVPQELEAIRERSRQRTASDEAFLALAREVESARERSEKTRQSLLLEDVKRERAEARKFEENRDVAFHGGPEGEEKENMKSADPAERHRLWLEKVEQDPYTLEAMNVLTDLASLQREGVAGPAGKDASATAVSEEQRAAYSRPIQR